MNKMMTKEYAAREFLKQYVKEHNIEDISELFSKDTLIEFSYDSDWEWAIKDEILVSNCSEEEAQKRTMEWYMGMSKVILFYEKMSTYSQDCLILDMAEDLGFEWEE